MQPKAPTPTLPTLRRQGAAWGEGETRLDFSRRADVPEQMDDPALPPATYALVMADLAQVNTLTLARRPTLAWLARATKSLPAFTLIDVGFGHGDMLRAIAVWARRRGIGASLTGVDLNPKSAPVAVAATDPALNIAYVTGDAADQPAPDFVVSSITAHHMNDAELTGFLRWMEATAKHGWFVNDLHRSRIAWAGFAVIAMVMRWHPIVRHDGMVSVRRSFRRADWERLIAAAGIDRSAVTIRWVFPFRLCVGRIR